MVTMGFPSILSCTSSARLRFSLTLAALCLVSVPFHAQVSPSSPEASEREFQAAMAAQDKGDLESAKAILLKLRRGHPGVFAVDESLGMIYAAQEKFATALPLLEAAAGEQQSSDVAHANLGAALYKLHRNEDALREFERAAQINPENAVTEQSLGEVWLDAGKPQEAAKAFTLALKEKPDDPDLELDLATALVAAGNLDSAQETLSRLPGIDASADAQSLLGQISEKDGHFEEAVRHFTRAAELEPSEANLWAIGVEFLRHWTFDAAIREFEMSTVKYPASTRMKLGLGVAYFGGEKYAQAAPIFAELLAADNKNALYADFLGMACTAVTGSNKTDCSPLVKYAESHPHNAKADTYAATALLEETAGGPDEDKALALLRDALASDPKLPDAQYQMGKLKQDQGDWVGSVTYLQAAVALKPDFAQAHYRLALAYARTGRKEEGKAEIELQKKYAQQVKQDLNQRLRQITVFLVDLRN